MIANLTTSQNPSNKPWCFHPHPLLASPRRQPCLCFFRKSMADASTSAAPSIFLLRFWPALISSTCLTSHSFFPFFALLPTTPFSFLLARTHTPRTLHSRRSGNRTRRGREGRLLLFLVRECSGIFCWQLFFLFGGSFGY